MDMRRTILLLMAEKKKQCVARRDALAALNAEYDKKEADLEAALAAVRKLNTIEVCPDCDGEGKVLRKRACAEDDAPDPSCPADWMPCDKCDGKGFVREPTA